MERNTPLTRALGAAKPALRSAFFISFFINLTLFASPLYSMQVYDRVLSSRNLGTLAMLTLIVAVFVALYGFLEYVRSGVLMRGSVRFNEVISEPLFDTALKARLAGRDAAATQAFKDGDCLRDSLGSGTISSLFDTPWSIAFVFMCYLLHPALGLVALLGTLVILACALLSEWATRKGVQAATRASADAGRFIHAVLRNSESVRGLGMDEAVLSRWKVRQDSTVSAQAESAERSAGLIAVSKSVRMGVQVGLLCTGAWLAVDRLISPGVMLASMIIMARALAPIEQAVSNWKRVIAFRDAHKRLDELFTSIPATPRATGLPAPKGHLSVEDLVVASPKGGQPILKGVSFTLPAGESLAIIGPSGSGKSSLARALAGIWQPAKGAVRIDGAALSHWRPDDLGPNIGFLPQEVEFLPGTVAENIARLGVPDDQAVIAAAEAAMVHETILRLTAGYETQMGEGGVILSGGQRQRVALARALYGSPRLVIMDEPNSNLDADGEAALAKALTRMKEERQTAVVVTHKMQLLRYVDHVLVLGNGTVRAFGKREEMLAKIVGPKVKALPTEAAPRKSPAPAASVAIANQGA